jgi:hypothetical protein
MYPSGNLQNSGSGERHSSYQHYAMSQVNNEKPVIQREHEEQNQSWGQPPPPPSSSSPSFYPSNIDSDRNYNSVNRLASSSSSLFDRNNAALQDNFGANLSNSYQGYGQRSNTSSSYSKISHNTTQQPGIQHFHDVPFYHGFKFQAIPGLFSARMKNEFILLKL